MKLFLFLLDILINIWQKIWHLRNVIIEFWNSIRWRKKKTVFRYVPCDTTSKESTIKAIIWRVQWDFSSWNEMLSLDFVEVKKRWKLYWIIWSGCSLLATRPRVARAKSWYHTILLNIYKQSIFYMNAYCSACNCTEFCTEYNGFVIQTIVYELNENIDCLLLYVS